MHVHDISPPFETARSWTFQTYRFWNEQYLLHAFLTSNADREVLYAGALSEHYLPGRLDRAFPLTGANGGFWMRRRGGRPLPAP